ncbi:MAG: nitrite reductase large subunit NirB [Cellvibrionaceae bacterium]|nr:nitrite reductase large subunit NirB [Cellvibrionaceae bacterium]
MNKQKIVVIGNGMVGHKFIENMLAQEKSEAFELTTFSEEPRLAYDRVQLSSYFSGASAEDLMLTSAAYYRDRDVNYVLNDKVAAIDTANNKVLTESGLEQPYDKLILATGSFPFVPPIPGHEQAHCLVYRTIEDLEAITESAKQSQVGVVVGGGLLGLEAANALKNLGLDVHVVEFAPRLMAVQLDEGGGQVLQDKIEALGVNVHTDKNTREIVAGEGARYRMNFADGSHLETDMILFSAGIRPQDELARKHGIAVGERGGIVIDNNCQTSVENIYAIGECALWNNRIFGLVAPGYAMAKVAASHIAGGTEQFTGADMSTKLKLLGVDVASVGDAHGRSPGCKSYVYQDGINGVYKRMVISEDNRKLLGAVLVGDVDTYGTLQQMCVNALDLPEEPEVLIVPSVEGGASSGMGVDALPDSAHICTCNEVTKGQICSAVSEGATTIGAIKSATKAGTSCGGCVALATQVMNAELLNLGVEVNTDICEHFPHTRQELYHMVRVEQIKSFDALIERHGKGLGCDICKPTVASILASCWNQYVLDDQLAGLQDTNDHFMANMQKNGTYSIVPRIAGGEITPDKLIAIGQVAKKYNLYTKITGGQRIDMFGAQQNELPLIWKELIDAGFETGHAYGKAVRTVKSCVGSTWCRYGMLDSVAMAINIEQRYKGLRAPHKLKFAVSGCTRECAEAQSKDVGVIATADGWSLYFCGNGGMKPRHADLFATGLDDKTLIQYIDRFLMFYVRTADRLQRTSTWMENLEGGLDYLRTVVIEDKLNICEELEREMSHVVGTYQCEWRTTIEDPEKVKRFRTFVNSDEKDSTVLFVEEREQIRPANEDERLHFVASQSTDKIA